jgi:HD superfamily phosphohydrolase
MSIINKKKIINDPVYGFINITDEIIFDIIEHPYFQRLRRIKQLGLSHLVYPSAVHSRFSHALGAMYLMGEALQYLQHKGHTITTEELKAARIAILLHDIGHGPFSHTLEYSIIKNVSHEQVSLLFMEALNKEFGGKLDMAIAIFKDEYHKHFIHQLVSSQLDVDRLDYLRRDSFFTGVSEGVIGTQRILKMLEVVDDRIVVEKKGIYSIENFLNSRRIMYWQVYLHKTVLGAEHLLMDILKRAKEVYNTDLWTTPTLEFFLANEIDAASFKNNNKIINKYSLLDDYDILSSIKVWAQYAKDAILKDLSRRLINRNFFRIEFSDKKFNISELAKYREKAMSELKLTKEDSEYYVFADHTSNYLYSDSNESIDILEKNGIIKNIGEVSEQLSVNKLKKAITKHFLCYPKNLNITIE